MARKKLREAIAALLTASTGIGSGHKIPFSDGNGILKGQGSMQDLQGILEKLRKDGAPRLGDSVFIATVESDYPRFWLPEYFAASNAANAVGVMVKDGDNYIVVAKDEAPTPLAWNPDKQSGGSGNCGRTEAFKDHNWLSKTTTVVNNLGDNAPAAKFCANYYPANMAESNAFYGKGRWGMPAGGDIWMMYQHFNEINYALSLINGTPLSREVYWSITEISATNAWILNFYHGHFNTNGKDGTRWVRPVSAFY